MAPEGHGGFRRIWERPKWRLPVGMTLQSSAFQNGDRIPIRHTGDGEDHSPPLTWSIPPPSTRELVLLCDDPDAPRTEPWVHWVIYNLPLGHSELPEGIPKVGVLTEPRGALQGVNSWGNLGYGGPAPPAGHGQHRYYFRLYALSSPLAVGAGLSKPELLRKIEGLVVARGELMGTYSR